MNTKTIKNLVHLQRKMSVVNKYADPFFPLLGMAFIMVLSFVMFDDFEEIISDVTVISLNIAFISSTQMAVQVYFGRYESLNLNTLPATNAEKFVSIICVILLNLLRWAVAMMLGFVAMCIIGTSFYDTPSSKVAALSAEYLYEPSLLIIIMIVVAAVMMWIITRYVNKKLKYRTRIMMLVCVLPVFFLEYLPEEIVDPVAYTYFTSLIVVAFAWNYHCFKRNQLK